MPAAAALSAPGGLRYAWRRAWRVFASGLSFTCFGLGGVLLGVLVFPLLALRWRDAAQRRVRTRAVIGLCMRVFASLMSLLGLIEVRWRGAEYLATPGAVVAPNHPTLIDVVLLLARAPQLDCVVKDALLRNPFTRGPVSAAGYIPNAAGPELVDRCAAAVRAGRSVLIFPEGTRSVPGTVPRLLRGACGVAVRAEGQLVPVVIRCDPPALSKQHRWYDLPAGPLRIDIHVHAPWSARSFLRSLPAANAESDEGGLEHRARAAREMTRALAQFYREALFGRDANEFAAPAHAARGGVPGEGGE